jgi:hypothetical protein
MTIFGWCLFVVAVCVAVLAWCGLVNLIDRARHMAELERLWDADEAWEQANIDKFGVGVQSRARASSGTDGRAGSEQFTLATSGRLPSKPYDWSKDAA